MSCKCPKCGRGFKVKGISSMSCKCPRCGQQFTWENKGGIIMKLKCYVCGESVKPKKPNSKKVNGVWIHKMCPYYETELLRVRKADRKNQAEQRAK